MKVLNKFLSHPNMGLLLMRVALGIIMITHSIPKFLGGASELYQTGIQMQAIGCSSWPVALGMIIALAEAVCGLTLIIGIYFRLSCVILSCIMGVSAAYTLRVTGCETFNQYAYPLSMSIVFLSLAMIGAGHWSAERGSS